jgi:putative addiction module killer protein
METKQTLTFSNWMTGLRDQRARLKIATRIARIEAGLLGDIRSIGDGVSEVKIDFGPGYRLYFTRRGEELIILLCGGDKGSQDRDIAKAKQMLVDLE